MAGKSNFIPKNGIQPQNVLKFYTQQTVETPSNLKQEIKGMETHKLWEGTSKEVN